MVFLVFLLFFFFLIHINKNCINMKAFIVLAQISDDPPAGPAEI